MIKQQLKAKLIDFQEEILCLKQQVSENEKNNQAKQQANLLEIIAIVDSFENIFNNLQEKEAAFDKATQRMLKSFKAIYRKTNRLLETNGVSKIEFPDQKAQIGLCKVIETQMDAALEDGVIIAIVKQGYQQHDRVIRSAEVITVLNNND